MNTSEIVIIGPGNVEKPVPTQGIGGPSTVKAGSGGSLIRLKNGRELRIAGEALRHALANGAVILEK